MAKKKTAPKSEKKADTTLIRVSVEFAEAISKAAAFEQLSAGEFATAHLLAIVEKRYRDAVLKEAKRMEADSK